MLHVNGYFKPIGIIQGFENQSAKKVRFQNIDIQ